MAWWPVLAPAPLPCQLPAREGGKGEGELALSAGGWRGCPHALKSSQLNSHLVTHSPSVPAALLLLPPVGGNRKETQALSQCYPQSSSNTVSGTPCWSPTACLSARVTHTQMPTRALGSCIPVHAQTRTFTCPHTCLQFQHTRARAHSDTRIPHMSSDTDACPHTDSDTHQSQGA